MTTETNPLTIDRFTVHIDNVGSGQLVITDRDLTPISAATAEAVLGDRAPVIVWEQSDRHGYIVFPVTNEGSRLADLLCDQLNAADGENDAATLAERIEAAPIDGLTAEQRRGLAAYQRAAVVPPHPYSAACGHQYSVGDRVRIGTSGNTYERGVMSALCILRPQPGTLATVILPDRPGCPLIVITDDDDILALPSPALYVHPVTE